MVGDVAAGDALLAGVGADPQLIVHDQRYLLVDADRVPAPTELPDPGLRRAEAADLPKLAGARGAAARR